MTRIKTPRFLLALLSFLALALPPAPLARGADHGDAPNGASDRGTDIADVYFFLDPNDNSRVILILTFNGFIVPGESVNFGVFDPIVRYSFEFENTGDARPDAFINIHFTPRTMPGPQMATVILPDGRSFTAPATNPSATASVAPPPTITTDTASGVRFFAGLTDDPFFFDIPGFLRYVASIRAGAKDPTLLERGRDTFAGYNILAMALDMPVSMVRGPAGNVVGVSGLAQRRQTQRITQNGVIFGEGKWINADRMGNPGINVALLPFARKNEYNRANPLEDADGRFASDIVGTLRALGTNDTNIGILANLAVTRGDFLRLDTSIPNSGPGGGNNAGAGFPNGRRLADDTIDTILFFVNNQVPLSDNANSNEIPLRDTFPFLAPSHQGRPPGTVDDQTRN